MNRHRVIIALTAVGTLSVACGIWLRPRADNTDVLRAAYEIPNGGGYCDLQGTGVGRDIVFKDIRILPRSRDGNYYCCGYTFDVAMRAAEQRGLLRKVEPYQIRRFQQEWYGATPGSRLKQVVTAMENLAIGKEVYPLDARPGDFAVFSRRGSGHSVIFLDWVKREGRVVGIRYRSSQPSTNGVGNQIEYFKTSGGTILPEYFFVGRLKS